MSGIIIVLIVMSIVVFILLAFCVIFMSQRDRYYFRIKELEE